MKIAYPWLWRGGFVLVALGGVARALGAPRAVLLVVMLGSLLVAVSLYRKPGDGEIPPRV